MEYFIKLIQEIRIMSEKLVNWRFILIWMVFFAFGLSSVITAVSHVIEAMK
ncbi:hypothetical protein CSW98_01485 [Vibrio sp. HA2012]|nr:hypothetical protein CSW98_01485 [Vibrio sp. HA2012]